MAARELSPVSKHHRHLSKTIKQKKDLSNLKPVLPQPDSMFNKVIQSPDPKLSMHNRAAEIMQPAAVAATTPQQAGDKSPTCSCVCKCFGYFRYDEWPNLDTSNKEKALALPQFGEADIKIVYRDRIKVFFKTAQSA